MTQRLLHISPLQAGTVAAVLYGMLSLCFAPFLMLPGILGLKNMTLWDAMSIWVFWLPLLFIPVYVIAGFLISVLMAWFYKLIADWVGGIEITLQS